VYRNDDAERVAAVRNDSHHTELVDIQVLVSYPYESVVDENVQDRLIEILGAMHRGGVKHLNTREPPDFRDLYESLQLATVELVPKLQIAENVYQTQGVTGKVFAQGFLPMEVVIAVHADVFVHLPMTVIGDEERIVVHERLQTQVTAFSQHHDAKY
jgi:hypothetical protein